MIKQLEIDNLQKRLEDLCADLKYNFQGIESPMEVITLSSSGIFTILSVQETNTDSFGHIINEWRKEFMVDIHKIEAFRSLFWWPAVESKWFLQCFSVHREKKGDTIINDLYMLARVDTATWIGVKTQRIFTSDD